tara:strand:- start:684 stop:1775 length:1092 start_codon:yes stop_codon:yes gene_type:complete
MKKLHKILFGSLTLFIVFIVAIFGDFQSFTVYPIDDLTDYEVGTYHETMDSNWTIAKFDTLNKQIVFSYQLSKDKEEPFAAFYFRDKNIDSSIVDVKNYDSFSIYLKADKAQKIPISFRFQNDSLIKLSKSYPEISVTKVVDYTTEGVYTVKLDEFEIAAWWLRYHGIEKENIDLKSITQLKYLAIGSCQALEPGASDVIVIDQVKFFNDYTKLYIGLVVFLIVVFIGLYILGTFQGSKKTIVVEQINIENQEEKSAKQVAEIKNYIGQNFSNPDLNMYRLQKEFKYNATELRKVFKVHINDSFIGYLKAVRMAEVKRLLQVDSDLSISEIAYKCGYNDIPYFNRQFKSETGQTPKEFKNSFQ